MTVLVTGGAGYIGAHVVRLLDQRGTKVVVVDDMSTGNAERLPNIPLYALDLSTDDARPRLEQIFHEHDVEAVIHFAAKKQVGESVMKPAWYFRQNVGGLANVLMAMESARIGQLIFSSSAAVYGMPDVQSVDETVAPAPINPYGESKLVGEWLIQDAERAWGLRSAILRYFNVAGAGWDDLGDPAVLNLVTIVMDQIDNGESPRIFGGDYDTPDGTCVRDYVHVMDLASAHVTALDTITATGKSVPIVNIGTGHGSSVQEVIDHLSTASHTAIQAEIVPRRAGDPAQLTADVGLANIELGWKAKHSLPEIVSSAWQAHVAARPAR